MKASVVALAGLAAASEVSPVEKVITLIEDLIDECEADSSAAHKEYDTFACWCKTTTLEKSDSVTDGQDNINQLSADLKDKTAEKEEKEDEVQRRKKEDETLNRELEDTENRCTKERVQYETKAADMDKGISSLEAARDALEESKPASLLAMSSVKETLRSAAAMSKRLTAAQKKQLGSFLQVDPEDPEYAFHSQGIMDIINSCLTDFQDAKTDLDAEWEKTKKNCDDTKLDLRNQITENLAGKRQAETRASDLQEQIAEDRSALVEAESGMKDDQQYLQDLTKECEERAKDYDQQSTMRGDEISALSQALDILKNKVQSADENANERAFVQVAKRAKLSKAEAVEGVESFLKEFPAKKVALNFLQRSATSTEVRQQQVAQYLSQEGSRLKSMALQSLSVKVAGDPFKKVKELIQKLIERLITEATEEATKKGFCDTELGKAQKERQFRWNSVMKLNAAIQAGEVREESLSLEIEHLEHEIHDLEDDLQSATEDRFDQKEENVNTMKEAKRGLDAVNSAILVLKVFYKNAAKASLLQASPIAEDNPGAQKGAYKGKQGASHAIIGLLEVISSDFKRTLQETEAEEKAAAAEFVEFERTSKSDIAGKTTKKELDEGDLHKTKTQLKKDSDDLKDQMQMVDAALEELEELKPMCIDTGMSYEERVEKREEEIDALKKAMCMLDSEGVEPECL
jgi:chromosome segregation ATPase